MGHQHWTGTPWTWRRVLSCYASECARRGEKPRGRKPALPEAMRRRIRIMSRGEGQSNREIADWLNANGVRRPNGQPWTTEAVRLIVVSEDRRLARAEDAALQS